MGHTHEFLQRVDVQLALPQFFDDPDTFGMSENTEQRRQLFGRGAIWHRDLAIIREILSLDRFPASLSVL
jgi:hypothetical protein